MANLKFYGVVTEIQQPQTGFKQDGTQWWSQSFTIKEGATNYPSTAEFVLYGDKLTESNVEPLVIGNDVTVCFNLKSRSWTGMDGNRKSSTELRAWKVEQGNTIGQDKPAKQETGEFTPAFAATTDNNNTHNNTNDSIF